MKILDWLESGLRQKANGSREISFSVFFSETINWEREECKITRPLMLMQNYWDLLRNLKQRGPKVGRTWSSGHFYVYSCNGRMTIKTKRLWKFLVFINFELLGLPAWEIDNRTWALPASLPVSVNTVDLTDLQCISHYIVTKPVS